MEEHHGGESYLGMASVGAGVAGKGVAGLELYPLRIYMFFLPAPPALNRTHLEQNLRTRFNLKANLTVLGTQLLWLAVVSKQRLLRLQVHFTVSKLQCSLART